MDTEYERETREQELQRREIEQQRRDREAEMVDAPALLKTPRDRVAGYVGSALRSLRALHGTALPVEALRAAQDAARWLDMAQNELDSPAIVDGAAMLSGKLSEIGDYIEEGELGAAMAVVREALDLLARQVRYPDSDEIPLPTDFDTSGDKPIRDAVRAVLKRHEGTIGVTDANLLRAEVVDAIIVAAQTGI